MQLDVAPSDRPAENGGSWSGAVVRVLLAWAGLFLLTFREWTRMAHQWWNIDTYSHILLIPAIIAWLVWLQRDELRKIRPSAGWIGFVWLIVGLAVWLAGRTLDINLIAQAGTLAAFQGAAIAVIGGRASLVLAFPLFYSSFLVPFGDEIIPQLQAITAHITTWLTVASGIETVSDGIYIDTPAGLFIVAEACSGVKFLIAMVTLGILVAHACFTSWNRRLWFLLACVVVPIVANGVRAWATIFIAQYVGAEAAGSFDHIVYGWFFFGIVIALVLGVAWRWFERDPEDAGFTAQEAAAFPVIERFDGAPASARVALAIVTALIAFAVLVRLV